MKRFQFKNWSMFSKIQVIGISVSLVFLLSILLFLLPRVEKFSTKSKQNTLTNLTQVAFSIIEDAGDRASKGEITIEEAQQFVKNDLRKLTYEGNNYFWINDLNKVMVLHPIKPTLEGKDMSQTQDPNGLYLFDEFIKATSSGGEGIVNYMWPKPGSEKDIPKMSYVKLYEPWGWIVGTGIYVEDLTAMLNGLRIATFLIVGVCIIISLALSMYIGKILVGPIKTCVHFAKEVAEGNLTETLEIHQSDEIGVLAYELNLMVNNLEKMFSDISQGIDLLRVSSNQFVTISQQFSSNAQQSGGKANEVAAKAIQMSQSIDTISSSSDETLLKISSIVSSIEEMNATFNEISRHTENARQIVDKAVERSVNATGRVDQLGEAALDINQVTEAITSISEQTNLLALNATIEAASAGDAGKGFSVVANEIKDLARQTALATSDIREKIEGIQRSTSETVLDIKDISNVIEEVNQYVTSIAGSIEEQAAVTGEIAENVNIASNSLGMVNSQVVDSHKVSKSVAGDMAEVGQSSSEVVEGCSEINESAVSLSELAVSLENTTRRFRLKTITADG